MIEGKILFAKRTDLREIDKDKPLEDITVVDFAGRGKFEELPMENIHKADFILFVDDDGRERIFKSRHGKDDIIF
jgi:hypothetical protein